MLKRLVKKSLGAAKTAAGVARGMVMGPQGPGYGVAEFSEFDRIRAEAHAQDVAEGNIDEDNETHEEIEDGTREVSTEDLRVMLEIEDGDDQPILLDVREIFEWNVGHLKGAVHIPLNQLEERIDELSRKRSVVVYCASGMRSIDGSYVLKRAGYGRVYSLAGGISGWTLAGNEVVVPS